MELKFKIEQIAIAPADPAAARELLEAMGAVDWVADCVCATGEVYGEPGSNAADLSFNYDMFSGKEFEILNYTNGLNWIDNGFGRDTVSHFGMHCTAEELVLWRQFFEARRIDVAQEVMTDSHTNPHIAGKRWYNYVIFDTKGILGVDLKFIVRLDQKPT